MADSAIMRFASWSAYTAPLIKVVEDGDLWLKVSSGNPDPNNYRCQQIKVSGHPDLRRFDEHFYQAFGDALSRYNAVWRTPANSDSGYTLLKYRLGDECTLHCDLVPYEQRVCTAILYANDDYEGGDLVFPNQDLRIRPAPGEMVVMPASEEFAHKVEPITKGNRYCVRCFFTLLP